MYIITGAERFEHITEAEISEKITDSKLDEGDFNKIKTDIIKELQNIPR